MRADHHGGHVRATNSIGYDHHVPDGLLRIKGKMPIAIELELTAKSRARLEGIIDSYLQSDLGEVWYFVTNDQVQRKLEAATDGYEMFKIQRWTGSS